MYLSVRVGASGTPNRWMVYTGKSQSEMDEQTRATWKPPDGVEELEVTFWENKIYFCDALLVGGLVAIFYFPIYWEFHHPN